MRFLVFKSDIELLRGNLGGKDFFVRDATSVEKQKNHFFETLSNIGSIIFIEDTPISEIRELLQKPDVILATIHGDSFLEKNHDINEAISATPRRVLQHALGACMLPEGLFRCMGKTANTSFLVCTDFEKRRIERMLCGAAPFLGVFTPRIDTHIFYPPSNKERLKAREKYSVGENDIHLVYAGRWLATKGICQVIRALSIWPSNNVRFTIAGNFCPDFPIESVWARHDCFEQFFMSEIAETAPAGLVNLLGPLQPGGLRELYWSADAFVYPSVHEDENFGMAPREAALCGLPCIVTDFGGLHEVSRIMPYQTIETYPTTHGSRYSLQSLREAIKYTVEIKGQFPCFSIRDKVMAECDIHISRENLINICNQ